MRYGILSDVHSNIEALSAVFDALDQQRIDSFLCLGDVVGYGASPNECCELIRERCDLTLLGNHDAAVAGRMDYSFYYEAARHALDWSAGVLTGANRDWLRVLPYTYRVGDVGFSHGSPLDPEAYEYIFALEQARELIPFLQDLPEITFIGHSHLCKAFAVGAAQANDVIAPQFGLRRSYRYLVSVGSVGQPRDNDPRSCCTIFDTDTRSVQFLRVGYDIEKSAQKIYDADLAPNFGRRLFLGV
jgi:diadenosine tetraphosphatase ApaH/serine/threonine PP2A family protein phosphatase